MADDSRHTATLKVGLKRLDLREYVETDPMLAQSTLFTYLDGPAKDTLLASGVARRYAQGMPIYEQGVAGDSLFLVLRGEVGLSTGALSSAVEAYKVGRGEFFGQDGALGLASKRATNAVAVGEVDIAEFPRPVVAAFFHRYPLFQAHLRETHQRRAAAGSELSDFLNRW